MLKSAVERQFAIVGEALRRLAADDAATAGRLRDVGRIIAFRNILIHGYDVVDDAVVWDIVANWLPALRGDLEALLAG